MRFIKVFLMFSLLNVLYLYAEDISKEDREFVSSLTNLWKKNYNGISITISLEAKDVKTRPQMMFLDLDIWKNKGEYEVHRAAIVTFSSNSGICKVIPVALDIEDFYCDNYSMSFKFGKYEIKINREEECSLILVKDTYKCHSICTLTDWDPISKKFSEMKWYSVDGIKTASLILR